MRLTQSVLRISKYMVICVWRIQGGVRYANNAFKENSFGKAINNCRVAAAINYDVGNLSRLERGAQTASLEIAEKLVKFYEKKITEMQILYPQRYM